MAYALLEQACPPVGGQRARSPVVRRRHPKIAGLRIVDGAGFRDLEDAQVARAIQPVGPEDRDWDWARWSLRSLAA